MSELESTNVNEEEASSDIWGDDKLDRKADADYLIRFLTSRIEERGKLNQKKSYVLNVDSQWGGGKTFFLTRLGKQLEADNHLVADVNAWEDDHAEDPLIAVMAAIGIAVEEHIQKDEQLIKDLRLLNSKVGKVAIAVGAKFLRHQADKYLGEGAVDLIGTGLNAVKETENVFENVIKNFQKEKQEIHDFRTELEKFLGKLRDVKKPLFILVDEMDRCRPPYAISLLERVKHLFNIDNVVFVFATDTKQLSHSIKAVYGEGFESLRYLHRFFDQTYMFPEPSAEEFIAQLLQAKPIPSAVFHISQYINLAKFCSDCFEDVNLSLRDIEQCMDILHNVVSGWPKNGLPIQGVLMLPLVVAYHRHKNIHLPWGTDLFNEIGPDVAGSSENEMAWKVSIPTGDYDGSPHRMKDVNCWDILELYIKWSLLDFNSLAQRGDPNQKLPLWKRRVQSSIEIEHQVMGAGIQPAELMLRQYPQVIASAGRLRRK